MRSSSSLLPVVVTSSLELSFDEYITSVITALPWPSTLWRKWTIIRQLQPSANDTSPYIAEVYFHCSFSFIARGIPGPCAKNFATVEVHNYCVLYTPRPYTAISCDVTITWKMPSQPYSCTESRWLSWSQRGFKLFEALWRDKDVSFYRIPVIKGRSDHENEP